MKSKVSEVNAWKRQLDVEVPYEDILPFIEKTMKSYRQKAHLDGFRKGKAPKSLIIKRFGPAIQADAADDAIQAFFWKAVQENELPIVAPGAIQDVSFNENEPLKFTAEVEVRPEIEVDHYKGLKLEKIKRNVTQDDVDQTLTVLQEQRAEYKEIDSEAQDGNIVEGDAQGLDESGVPIIGQKWENSGFVLGQPPLGDLVKDQLLGCKAGDERKLLIVPPEGSPEGSKEQQLLFSVKSVKEKVLPALDDDFAKGIGQFESVDALKEDILTTLKNNSEEDAEKMLRHQIIDEILKKNEFELPPSMIEGTLDRIWEEHQKNPRQEVDEATFRQENRAPVIFNLRWNMVWPKLAEIESITVADDDLEKKVDEMAKESPKEEHKIRAWFRDEKRKDQLRDNLLEEKVFDFIKENAKIKETTPKKPKKAK